VHYFAPLLGLQWMLLMRGWRGLAMSPRGAQFALWIGLGCVVSSLWPFNGQDSERTWGCCTAPGNLRRAAIEKELLRKDGLHLVIVKYSAAHNIHEEWVYNRADIDSSKIIWARAMSEEEDARLIEAYKDRAVLRIEPDEDDLGLRRVR
jgi:hypothetical protein